MTESEKRQYFMNRGIAYDDGNNIDENADKQRDTDIESKRVNWSFVHYT